MTGYDDEYFNLKSEFFHFCCNAGPYKDIQYAESKLKIMMVLTKGHKCHYFMFIMDHISETMRGDKSLGGIIQSLLL